MKKEFLETGKIVSTHGLHGDVKILPWADSPEFLLEFDRVFVGKKEYAVEDARVQKTCVLMKLKGIDTVEEAAKSAARRKKGSSKFTPTRFATIPQTARIRLTTTPTAAGAARFCSAIPCTGAGARSATISARRYIQSFSLPAEVCSIRKRQNRCSEALKT